MKLKLVKPKRLLISIIILLSIVISILFIISTNSLSHSDINYKNISVVSGDTLWSIAQTEKSYNSYYLDKDVRFVIENIKSINNLENSDLSIGKVLNIPVYK